MSLNGVSSTTVNTNTTSTSAKSTVNNNTATQEAVPAKETQNVGVVYESTKNKDNSSKNVTYKQDMATINKLKSDADARNSQLKNLVEKLLLKQGETFDAANMYNLLREGKVKADPETIAQAQKDISEDGYYGVKQTSERLVSFAKALTGGDPSKADMMIKAVQKGFEEAEKAWGGKLPGICQETYDVTMKQLEEWKNSGQ